MYFTASSRASQILVIVSSAVDTPSLKSERSKPISA